MPEYTDIPEGFSVAGGSSDIPEGFRVVTEPEKRSLRERVGRQIGLTGRILAEGAADFFAPFADALGAMMNTGIQAAGSDYRVGTDLSGGVSELLTSAGVPEPEGAEKAVNFVGRLATGIAGGGKITNAVARRFTGPAASRITPREQILQRSQREGYVVPPATARPNSITAGLAEGAAGKLKTAQLASAMNQTVTNKLAARAVGLADDANITPEALSDIRAAAGQAYKAIRGAGKIVTDTAYRRSVSQAVRTFRTTAKEFPKAAQNEILGFADDLNKPQFSSESAMDMLTVLRDKADMAFRTGQGGLGRAYKSLSSALESAIERSLARDGETALVGAFKAARKLIAKTYTIEGALRGNNVDAQTLARMLQRGKPLSDDIKAIAEFAQQFPKAARVALASESIPAYSPLDYWAAAASAGSAAATGNPALLAPAAFSVARPAIRNALLSPTGQKMLQAEPVNVLAPMVSATGSVNELLSE